jgi:hypothetical protein
MSNNIPFTITHPEIAREWHPERNSGLFPNEFSFGSRQKVWWKCEKGEDHEWYVSIGSRTANKSMCPICSGRKVVKSNSLETTNSDIAKEWNYEKNNPVKPSEITKGSNKAFWWTCSKNKMHLWKTNVKSRVRGSGCPFCSGHKVGNENNFEALYPGIAKKWDFEKNTDIFPNQISVKNKIKIWWKCEINPKHKWQKQIQNQIKRNTCPICEKEKKSLKITHPNLVKEWDFDRNLNINLNKVSKSSKLQAWWICQNDNSHKWKTKIISRSINNSSCPFCWRNNRIRHGNLLKTNPALATQWHSELNKDLKVTDVSKGMDKKVWWKCEKGDDHIWQAQIISRVRGTGCPVCANKKVALSNCLGTTNPTLSEEWDCVKNGPLTPFMVTEGSHKKVWWKCNKVKDHVWKATVYDRSIGKGCPICVGQLVVKSNCLASINPEIASQWHLTQNGKLTPFNVTVNSGIKVFWQCINNDEHIWKTSVAKRVSGSDCPFCTGQKVNSTNNLRTLYPEIADSWHSTKNGSLTPESIGACSSKKVWWKCSKGEDHIWRSSVAHRVNGRGCPVCAGKKVVESNSLQTLHPKLAKEWHPTKNGKLLPSNVTKGSYKKVWWKCQYNTEHIWLAIIDDRVRGNGCPFCKQVQRSKLELGIACELQTIFSSVNVLGMKIKINNYFWDVDIVIKELDLAIEYDGNYWHKGKEELDKRKSENLFGYGYKVIRIRENPLKKINKDDILIKARTDVKSIVDMVLLKVIHLFRSQLNQEHILNIESYLAQDELIGVKLFDKTMNELNMTDH